MMEQPVQIASGHSILIGWSFDTKLRKAPKGVWVDVGIIEVSGKECQIKNQKGTVKNGVLVNPSAPDTGSNTEP